MFYRMLERLDFAVEDMMDKSLYDCCHPEDLWKLRTAHTDGLHLIFSIASILTICIRQLIPTHHLSDHG